MATGRRTTPVLGKEQRKALLTYFVFRGTPPEEEKQEAEAAGDGQSGGSPRTPALSPAPSPLPPPTTATTASLCAAAVACLTGDAEDEEAADHDDDIVDCEVRGSPLVRLLLARAYPAMNGLCAVSGVGWGEASF